MNGLNRRQFLGSSMAALAGGAFRPLPPEATPPPKIKEYRVLGRTGFKVSDIGLGGGEATDPSLIEAALDSGINYIDAAENYVNGQVEAAIGKALKNRERKSVFITTKLGLGKDVSKASLLGRARKCLERLQTDYMDCLLIALPPDHGRAQNGRVPRSRPGAQGRGTGQVLRPVPARRAMERRERDDGAGRIGGRRRRAVRRRALRL